MPGLISTAQLAEWDYNENPSETVLAEMAITMGLRRDGDPPEPNRDESQEMSFMMENSPTSEELAEYYKSWSMEPFEVYFQRRKDKKKNDESSEASGSSDTPRRRVTFEDQDSESEVSTTCSSTYASRTKLTKGNSLLVDLGSMINVIGSNTAKDFAQAAEKAGHKTEFVKRKTRMNVNGVGAGSAPCDDEAILPIAVKFQNEQPRLDTYKANVAQGSGADLPAILGAISMQEKDTVLILRKGKQMMVFPGPGGYKIEWSPGTKLLPMIPAPSGHMVVPCDAFTEATADPQAQLAFITDHSQ